MDLIEKQVKTNSVVLIQTQIMKKSKPLSLPCSRKIQKLIHVWITHRIASNGLKTTIFIALQITEKIKKTSYDLGIAILLCEKFVKNLAKPNPIDHIGPRNV